MKGLYKGRYLIALYDSNDRLIEVAGTCSKIRCAAPESVSRSTKRHYNTKHKIYLIDCLEKHDDIFAEEDEEFLKWQKRENLTKKDKASEQGLAFRTYLRKEKAVNLVENSPQM